MMMRLFLTAALTAWASVSFAFGPLVDADSMDLPDGTLVLDIRGADAFAAGHIPGASNTPYGLYRGPKDNPGRVPSEAALQQVMRDSGAKAGQSVLVVHQGKNATDFGAAARVYWTLKSIGFEDLAILNGGYSAWEAAGGTPATGASTVTATDITVSFSDQWMMDTDDVKGVVSGDTKAVLLDARPLEFFEGDKKHGAAAKAGTLAGALNIVHSTWFADDGPVVNAPEDMLAEIRVAAASEGDAPLVSFCNTGHWAATNWFAASELAGVENVKLYPESMVGWTKLGLETVNGNDP